MITLNDNSCLHITDTGINTIDGELHEFDVIICATGFSIGFCPFFELKGLGGIRMSEAWDPEPKYSLP